MKDFGLQPTRISPCLRIFITSLLEGADHELINDALFLGNEPLGVEMTSALTPPVSLSSDKNYN